MGWFSKDKEKKSAAQTQQIPNEESAMIEFQDVLEKSLTEEKKGSGADKKSNQRVKEMVKILLKHKYSIDEINDFIKAGHRYELKKGEVVEK
jgi:hypothetical protein